VSAPPTPPQTQERRREGAKGTHAAGHNHSVAHTWHPAVKLCNLLHERPVIRELRGFANPSVRAASRKKLDVGEGGGGGARARAPARTANHWLTTGNGWCSRQGAGRGRGAAGRTRMQVSAPWPSRQSRQQTRRAARCAEFATATCGTGCPEVTRRWRGPAARSVRAATNATHCCLSSHEPRARLRWSSPRPSC
jgi:hypothetical protein